MNLQALKQKYNYDPDSGFIYYKGTDKRAECINKNSYSVLSFDGHKVLAHRFAWAAFYGEFPKGNIDHINHKKTDNRIQNLRIASVAENNRNRPIQKNNIYGFKGVSFHKASGKFRAQIKVDRQKIHLGVFETPESAFSAYCRAAFRYHGEFACVQ